MGKRYEQVAEAIGADRVIYQSIDGMKRAILQSQNPAHPAKIADFDASCFDGCYVTGDITPQFLKGLAVGAMSPGAKWWGGSVKSESSAAFWRYTKRKDHGRPRILRDTLAIRAGGLRSPSTNIPRRCLPR